MASRAFRGELKSLTTKGRILGFRFFPQGTSTTPMTVANGLLVGKGVASVTRQGTAGTYLVTFEDTYRALFYANVFIQMSSATDLNGSMGDVSNVGTASAVTAIVRALAAATPTDIAANANNSVLCQFAFEDMPV